MIESYRTLHNHTTKSTSGGCIRLGPPCVWGFQGLAHECRGWAFEQQTCAKVPKQAGHVLTEPCITLSASRLCCDQSELTWALCQCGPTLLKYIDHHAHVTLFFELFSPVAILATTSCFVHDNFWEYLLGLAPLPPDSNARIAPEVGSRTRNRT